MTAQQNTAQTRPAPADKLGRGALEEICENLNAIADSGAAFGNSIDPYDPTFHGALTEGERRYGKGAQEAKIFSAAALMVLAARYETSKAGAKGV